MAVHLFLLNYNKKINNIGQKEKKKMSNDKYLVVSYNGGYDIYVDEFENLEEAENDFKDKTDDITDKSERYCFLTKIIKLKGSYRS